MRSSFYIFLLINLFVWGLKAQTAHPKFDFELAHSSIEFKPTKDAAITKLLVNKAPLNGSYKLIKPDSTTVFVKLINGLQDGLYKEYYKTGELKNISSFDMGIKKDTAVWFFKNGALNRKIAYQNNKRQGKCEWFYDNGNTLKTCNFENNKENGICKWFFIRGGLKWLVTYRNGLKNGPAEKYNYKGELVFKGYYVNNVLVNKDVKKIDN